jgi:hypothetical protein
MSLPISTWALIAGLVAGAATIVLSRVTNLSAQLPPAVVWLGIWAALFVVQAAWWALRRKRQHS